ncbi:hypothetical protein IAU60_005476 [Kwoniella sp. DSM 27419]
MDPTGIDPSQVIPAADQSRPAIVDPGYIYPFRMSSQAPSGYADHPLRHPLTEPWRVWTTSDWYALPHLPFAIQPVFVPPPPGPEPLGHVTALLTPAGPYLATTIASQPLMRSFSAPPRPRAPNTTTVAPVKLDFSAQPPSSAQTQAAGEVSSGRRVPVQYGPLAPPIALTQSSGEIAT